MSGILSLQGEKQLRQCDTVRRKCNLRVRNPVIQMQLLPSSKGQAYAQTGQHPKDANLLANFTLSNYE